MRDSYSDYKVPFNIPPYVGTEETYIKEAIASHKICGDGEFTERCNVWFEERTGVERCLITTSCTHATELAALLADIKEGDEVIMPSYTFVSTANAFVLRGAKAVFTDIRPDTMNLDENKIEAAITKKTRAIVPVHYAGVGCEMDAILDIAKRHNLLVIEDAAQGVNAYYKGKALGALGDMGCYSFHETKNYSMGEGGALLMRDATYVDNATIMREKGTNRTLYKLGKVDKYTWIMPGSSYLPSELNAAYLYGQLLEADAINEDRLHSWQRYYDELRPLAEDKTIELPVVPAHCKHNAHMFYIKCRDLEERSALIRHMLNDRILPASHYIPLHSATAGLKYGVFAGEDEYTTKESERLLRLPMYYGLKEEDLQEVVKSVKTFYKAQ